MSNIIHPTANSGLPSSPQSKAQQLSSQLNAMLSHARKHQKLDPHDELTHNAQELVSQSFFGTLLKQAQQSPFHSDMFEGGKGGAAYQEMFNQKIAEHMSRGAGSKLVRPLIHKFQAGKAYKKHKSTHQKHKIHGLGSQAHHSGSQSGSQQVSSFLANMGA
jgi:Rod binding domain-containing protein